MVAQSQNFHRQSSSSGQAGQAGTSAPQMQTGVPQGQAPKSQTTPAVPPGLEQEFLGQYVPQEDLQNDQLNDTQNAQVQNSVGQDQLFQENGYQYQNQEQYQSVQVPQIEPEFLLLEWYADSRVSQQRSREYYSSLMVIVILVSLILFFANQVVLMVLVWAFLFITYVLGMVKAETVLNQITTYGVRYQNNLYFWDEMTRFWVMDNHGIPEIHIEVPRVLGNQIILLPSNDANKEVITADDIVDWIQRYVPYEQPLPSEIDRWVRWFEEKFPLESKPVVPDAPAPAPPAQEAQDAQAESQAQPQPQAQASQRNTRSR